MQARPIGLLILGTVLIVAGLFLPAITCDSKAGSFNQCNKDSAALFQSDYFKGSYDFWDGIAFHFFPITFVLICVIVVITASRKDNLFPVSLSLLWVVIFDFYLIWDDVERIEGINLSLGVAWLLLLGGAGLIAWLGFRSRYNSSRRHSTSSPLPAEPPTQNPY